MTMHASHLRQGSFDAQFFDPITQRAKAHAQKPGGCGLVVARLFKGFDDRFSFQVLQLIAEGWNRLDVTRDRHFCDRHFAGFGIRGRGHSGPQLQVLSPVRAHFPGMNSVAAQRAPRG